MWASGTASTRLKQCRGCLTPQRIQDRADPGSKGQAAGMFHDRLPGCTGGHAARTGGRQDPGGGGGDRGTAYGTGGRLVGLKDRPCRGRPSVYTPADERIMWRKLQDACRFAVTTGSLHRLCSPIGRCLMQPGTLSRRVSDETAFGAPSLFDPPMPNQYAECTSLVDINQRHRVPT